MNLNISFTQSQEVFNKVNTPEFSSCHSWFKLDIYFPFNLEFEKTYYKHNGNGLTAFRVLAYTIDDTDTNSYKLSFLVQLPNQSPQWISKFISRNTNVYASKEDYILSGGSQCVNLGWGNLLSSNNVSYWQGYEDRVFFKVKPYTIKNGAVCESKGHYCNRLLVTKNGWLVGISKRNLNKYQGEEGVYLNKADAMKVLLDDMDIIDFEEQPINIDITILPNTPKYTKIKFVE